MSFTKACLTNVNLTKKSFKLLIKKSFKLLSLSIATILALATLAISKSVYSTYISEGMSFYKLGYYDKAIENFNSALNLNPNDPLPYRMIGLSYYRKSNYDEALRYLTISLALEGENTITLSIIGNIYYSQKKYNNATLVYERLFNKENNSFVAFRLVKSFIKVGKYKEAVEYGEKALSSNISWDTIDKKTFIATLREAYVKYASHLEKNGKKEEAKAYIEKAKKLN
jgi:tetratricopeptide (TPR) repeat protein